jgi:hypothetical protein
MVAGPITIKSEHAEVAGSTARLRSAALATHLIQNQSGALGVLEQIAPVKASDISIDDQGRVIVDNDAFASALRKSIDLGTAADNHGCGLGCAAEPGDIAARPE